jgi:hypothetical protein
MEHSVFLVEEHNWYSMDIAATLFDPAYRRSVFIKKLDGERYLPILRAYPGRTIYLIQGSEVKKLGTVMVDQEGKVTISSTAG